MTRTGTFDDGGDACRSSRAAERNRAPIAAVLARHLPASGLVLEIASGTGQHAVFFAAEFQALTWQPSDPDESSLRSITAWRRSAALANLLEPVRLDVHERPWPYEDLAAVVCINMIHIAPWSATQALFDGASLALAHRGLLFLYGPYRVGGRHTAPSNEAFDASLRERNPEWGVRDLEAVLTLAGQRGFRHVETVAMPANNLSVALRLET
jgi:SAM-dependent methyltransferase